MKKLIVILMILIVGILACGCTSQPATPVATTVQTIEPTAVPTEVPTAVPTEVPTAVNTTVVPTTIVTTATPTPTPIPDVRIQIMPEQAFRPVLVTVPAGTKVIWYTNTAGSQTYQINIRSGEASLGTSNLITPRNTFSYTFTKAGTYTVTEITNAGFKPGKVIVT
jgi:plastocyanin